MDEENSDIAQFTSGTGQADSTKFFLVNEVNDEERRVASEVGARESFGAFGFWTILCMRYGRSRLVWETSRPCNIAVEALQGRLSELSSTSAAQRPRSQDKAEGSGGLVTLSFIICGLFNNAEQVAIFGGNFTIVASPAMEEKGTTPDAPDEIDDVLEEDREIRDFCPLTWIIGVWKRLFGRR
ncbi:hypothetical protein CPC08DRAFT_767292 [Agrocybe pediades]|nr:hypothetical protein CPC08DRAFT_767292 [Agrocybe pediades]